MRLALLLALFLVPAVAAPAAAAPPSQVRTAACLSAVEPGQRAARFEGEMRSVAGAVRLQMRFTLQARSAEQPRWAEVKAPGFGSWNTSAPGIGRFVYSKLVRNLLVPARYRAVVHFRWLGAAGKPILRSRRVSRTCRQPDLRPDLVATRILREDGGYAVTVENTGRTDAAAFRVTLESGGRTYELGRVARLAVDGRVVVRGTAPECRAGEPMTVHVDAENAVDEADEKANALVVSCPGPRT